MQLNLPLRNRVAQADAARDAVQVRQVQARTEKLANQIRAGHRERADRAGDQLCGVQGGGDQPRLPGAAAAGGAGQAGVRPVDATLLVVQNEAYLAQARSTEIAARSNYQKARIELDRSLGDLLEKNGISLEDAVQGKVKP